MYTLKTTGSLYRIALVTRYSLFLRYIRNFY